MIMDSLSLSLSLYFESRSSAKDLLRAGSIACLFLHLGRISSNGPKEWVTSKHGCAKQKICQTDQQKCQNVHRRKRCTFLRNKEASSALVRGLTLYTVYIYIYNIIDYSVNNFHCWSKSSSNSETGKINLSSMKRNAIHANQISFEWVDTGTIEKTTHKLQVAIRWYGICWYVRYTGEMLLMIFAQGTDCAEKRVLMW